MSRRFSQYKNLCQSLVRSKMREPGPTATVLLESFVNGGGKIAASVLYARGICKKNSDFQFVDWRNALVREDFLKFELKEYATHKEVVYFPGGKLLTYLNREKFESSELVNRQDLEFAMERVNRSLDRILEKLDPPANAEKREKLISGDYDRHIERISNASAEDFDIERSNEHDDEPENPELFPNHQLQ